MAVLQLLVTANIPSSSILVTLMMEVIRSSETSFFSRATRHNITEDSIFRYEIRSEKCIVHWL
jgi:hypothetical protein